MADPLLSDCVSREIQEGTMNTEAAEAKNFLVWVGFWIAALMALLPALASN